MAVVQFNELLTSVSGKICRKVKKAPIFAYNRTTGTAYVYHHDNEEVQPATPAQAAQRAKFAKAQEAVREIRKDADQMQAYQLEFLGQKKYKTFNGFLFAKVMKTV